AATAAKSRRLSLSSFPAIAGKGDRAVRGGRGAGLAEFSFNEDETSSQKPPPPPCVRYAHYGRSPSPAIAGAEGKRRRSRGAFLFAPESSAHYFQKRRRQPTFVRCPRQWNGRTHHDRGGARRFVGWAKARNAPCPRVSQNLFLKTAFSKPRGLRCAQPTLRNARTTKEAERRQTRVSLLHLPAKRAPWPGRARLSAFHCGSRQGDSWSPRLSVRPCFPGQSGAFGPVRPLQPGSGDLARLRGRYPRRNKSQCSEHLTCRSLCRQTDARRRPSAEGTNPLPASTGPAPASPSSLGWRPVRGARQFGFYSLSPDVSIIVVI